MDLTFPGPERKTMRQTSPLLQQVRAYWEGLRPPGGGLPRRQDIDPRGLSGALEHVFLAERVAPGMARLRLAGMHLLDLMGMEVRGMPLSALFEPVGRARLAAVLDQAFCGHAVLEFRLEAERAIGKPALEGRMLLLPVLGSRGEADLALGCLDTEGRIGRCPRRFAVAGLTTEGMAPATDSGAQPVGLAEPARPFLPAGRPPLRLVHSRE